MATGGRRDDPSSPSSSNYSSSSSGIKPWGLLVLFCIFILLFLPSFLSSSFRGFRPAAIKSGWDTLNFVLVVFAILCGVLGRRNEESGRSPTASSPKNWFSDHAAQSGYLDRSGPGHASGFRRMRSSSSYPDLRHEPEWGGANGWRCYDDTQLYRRRPESRGWESQSFGEWEDKTILVGSVRQRSPSPKSRPPLPPSPSPPLPLPLRVLSPPPPTSQPLATRSMHKLPNDMLENGMSDTEKYQLPPPPPEPQPRQGHRRGKSLEKVPEMIERDASTRMRHRRSRTVEDLPNWELEQAWNLGVQNAQMPHWASPPPPPPPPSHSKTNYKKRSGGGPKDIAAAITSFYQKKKKGKRSGRSYEDLSVYFDPSSSSAPPPPPPPPPPPSNSVFHHLFSHKKIKKRRNQSPPSAAPPPPPPPPPLRASTRPSKMMSSDPHSAPAPPPTHRSKRHAPVPRPSPPPPEAFPQKEEKPDIYDLPIAPPSPLLPPPPPPPPPPLRASSQPSKMSSDSHSSPAPPPTHRSKRQAPVPRPSPPPPRAFPLKEEKPDIYDLPVTPPSPLLPPPPPPPPPASDSQELLSDNEVINMERKSFKGTTTGESVALFCPSPDVNNKADLFIAKFHAVLKLEKLNSIREKQQQQQQQQEEEETMMIGSLFDDDLI